MATDASAPLLGTARFDHVGVSVPNLEEAVEFFRLILGAEEVYRSERSGQGDFMVKTFEASPEAAFKLCFLRLPDGIHIEVFEWEAPDRSTTPPMASDVGGHHICLYVEDIDDACSKLQDVPGVRVLGPIKVAPETSPYEPGSKWTYFVTPWGLQMELVQL